MTKGDDRYGSAPLGKSVEEVEQESGERHDPQELHDTQAVAPQAVLVPAGVNIGTSGVPAVINPEALVEGSVRAGETRPDETNEG